MKKCVIILGDGMIEDVLTSSKEPMEIMIVDFDKKALDQSALAVLSEPHDFEEVSALADIYEWDAVYDPERVKKVFAEKKPENNLQFEAL